MMGSLIRDLQSAGVALTDEQQLLGVIRSLPDPEWSQMKLLMTHSENIRTFDDISRHLELEAERIEANRAAAFVAKVDKREGFGPKRKKQGSRASGLTPKTGKDKKAKRGARGKKNLSKLKCYNCKKKGHFARDCPEPKKVYFSSYFPLIYVCSHALVAYSRPEWIVDTGATRHISVEKEGFVDYHRVPAGTQYVTLGNGTQEEVLGVGSFQLKMKNGKILLLKDVMYAPGVRCNLLSVACLLGQGYSFLFRDTGLNIYLDDTFFGSGFLVDGFFKLNLDHVCNNRSVALVSSTSSIINDDCDLWHKRLGHVGQERMARLAREGLLGSLSKVRLTVCEPCLAGKAKRKPFGKASRASYPLELVHSDICGPMNVRARHGASYFITFIDDYSRFGYVYLISHKSEALYCFRRFVHDVENQMDKSLKTLRTDRGREYLSDQFRSLCEEKGIVRHLTIPSTP